MLQRIRSFVRNRLDHLSAKWKTWKQSHPHIVRLYALLCWLSLVVFLLSLIYFKASRLMAIQFLWSFYVVIQFWLLARTKTLFWQEYIRFFLVGAWVIVPLTGSFVFLLHGMFGGHASDYQSSALVTPVVEELFKLIPLGVYLFISRRASSLSLSDYALIGAASGAGFQFFEETTRRTQSTGLLSEAFGGYGHSIFGQDIHWDLLTLFPGYFESEFLQVDMLAGHAVLTALVAVGIGLAIRLSAAIKVKLGKVVYILPLFLLCWAILDHGIWNGASAYPQWMQEVHDSLGSGYATKPTLLGLLVLAVFIDTIYLNRTKDKLPLLDKETTINPLTEIVRLVQSLKEPKRLGYLLLFYRERRQLAMTILFGEDEERQRVGRIKESVSKRGIRLAAMMGVLLIMSGFMCNLMSGNVFTDSACFACMFDDLFHWWDRLEWYEQGMMIAGVIALSWLAFGGLWSAVAVGSTFASVAGSGKDIARFLRNPWTETQAYWEWWEDLTVRERVEIAAQAALSQLLNRIGLGLAKRAPGLAKRRKGSVKGKQQAEHATQTVPNMDAFFKTDFGKEISPFLTKTKIKYDGQSIYKVSTKPGHPYLKKGYGIYLDALHKDHLEVIDKQGKVRIVLNLDGSVNKVKTAKAFGRMVKDWK